MANPSSKIDKSAKRVDADATNPVVEVALHAAEWVRMFDSLDHYYRILEAVDGGGDHREDRAEFARIYHGVQDQIRNAVREAGGK